MRKKVKGSIMAKNIILIFFALFITKNAMASSEEAFRKGDYNAAFREAYLADIVELADHLGAAADKPFIGPGLGLRGRLFARLPGFGSAAVGNDPLHGRNHVGVIERLGDVVHGSPELNQHIAVLPWKEERRLTKAENVCASSKLPLEGSKV